MLQAVKAGGGQTIQNVERATSPSPPHPIDLKELTQTDRKQL